MANADRTVPLLPRRRLVGLSFGGLTSARRGPGSDVAGSRPYQPGDDVDTIDWNASARLSSARGTDEFIVRERFAEEAPRVVVVADRRPEMDVFPVVAVALEARCDGARARRPLDAAVASRGSRATSTSQRRGVLAAAAHAAGHERRRRANGVRRADGHARPRVRAPGRAPPGDADRELCLRALRLPRPAARRRVDEAAPAALGPRAGHQDPAWEQNFPPIGGVVVPFWDPRSRRVMPVRLTDMRGRARRTEPGALHRDRREAPRYDLEPVVLSSDRRDEIFMSFLEWAELRRFWRGRTW